MRNVETPELKNSSRRRKSLIKWGKCGEDKEIKYSSWKYFINNWQSFTCLCHISIVSFDIHMAWPTELSSLHILYKRCPYHYWHYSMHYILKYEKIFCSINVWCDFPSQYQHLAICNISIAVSWVEPWKFDSSHYSTRNCSWKAVLQQVSLFPNIICFQGTRSLHMLIW